MKKVVLVTGGSSGIGKSISIYLQEAGYKVYGTSRNPSNYPDSPIDLVAMDVQDQKSIASTVQQIMDSSIFSRTAPVST